MQAIALLVAVVIAVTLIVDVAAFVVDPRQAVGGEGVMAVSLSPHALGRGAWARLRAASHGPSPWRLSWAWWP